MKPFVSMNEIRPLVNDLARNPTIEDALDTCLNTDILPNRAAHPFRILFNPAQGSMYVSRRTMKDPEVYSGKDEDFRYEEAMSRLFWKGAGADDDLVDRRRLCVMGHTGCGKSTFVDFFLRWYCPEKSGHAAQFARTIIVWFDANAAKDNERLNQNFFASAQAWIRTACQQKKVDIEGLVAKRRLPKQNVESWVQSALEEISRLSKAPDSGIEYLVIFVDNMDQCPVKVQERLLSTIENWFEMPTINIWRVILTMWPSTYATLKNSSVNMMRNWKLLSLGLIHAETLMENRRQVLNSSIARMLDQAAGAAASHGHLHEEFRSFMDASLHLWSNRLAGTLAELEESSDSSSVTSASGLVRDLCNGDLRRELGLFHDFVCGEGAHRMWLQGKSAAGSSRRHDYEIVESLILGAHDFMLHSADHIGNLFMLGDQQLMPRDMLIGPHMLHFLKEGVEIHDYQALCRAMTDLGYAENNFEHCFFEFRRLGILHEVRSERSHGVGYEVHSTVINAYHRLLYREPAYLDCLAPVTAVDDECLKEMRAVDSVRDDSFSRKTGCSLAFLRFLRRMEHSFCDASKVRQSAPQRFPLKLNSSGIPSLWRQLGVRYRERLLGLRSGGYLAHLSDDWWEETLHSQVLVDASAAAPTLNCSTPG